MQIYSGAEQSEVLLFDVKGTVSQDWIGHAKC
jgi:hypothetical protein